jgi:hypothetical protein
LNCSANPLFLLDEYALELEGLDLYFFPFFFAGLGLRLSFGVLGFG